MMAERHPDELDFLDLVEGELPRVAEESVAAHVRDCPACGETVRQLRAGRGALHASGVLQLSERARDGIAEAIDREPRLRAHRFRYWEHRRLGVVLGMTLVLVASVVAVAQWGGGLGGNDEAGGDAVSESAGGGAERDDALEGGGEGLVPETAAGPARVAGPAREVAADLRAEGFDARVENGEVIVRLDGVRMSGEPTTEEERLRELLAERPPGGVVVRLAP
jgi:anti-sigma factor RsiW